MQRAVECPRCGHRFLEDLPDITAAEAEELKAAGSGIEVQFPCPSCGERIQVARHRLLDPTEPP